MKKKANTSCGRTTKNFTLAIARPRPLPAARFVKKLLIPNQEGIHRPHPAAVVRLAVFVVVEELHELFGVEEKNDAGEKIDNTTDEAIITNSTDVMLTTVSGDEYSIGYVSLGSLNDSVKAVSIDGAEATVDDINDGTYKIFRPFNIATKGDVSDAAQDFINYIMSKDGQAVVEENKYIAVGEPEDYTSNGAEGKVVVAGSSSVSPVMQKLKEAYEKVNDKVEIEIQTSDSTTGMQNTIDGICDIGMASRELKDSETEAGLTATVIANDGIAVVVNNDNPTADLSKDTVKGIYTGEITSWDGVTE